MFERGVQTTEVSLDLTEICQRTRQIGGCGGLPTEVYGRDEIASCIMGAALAARLEGICYEILNILRHGDQDYYASLSGGTAFG
ncbi:MAG: hypothetical protein WA800_20935, partial [Terriglobales bacterium]